MSASEQFAENAKSSADLSKVDWAYFARGGTAEREKRIAACITALHARFVPSDLERDSREG